MTFDSLFLSKMVSIMGHRGGFRPMNSLNSFKMALDSQIVKVVELDVWLTKDKELIVVHGGDNGNINFATEAELDKYIFDHTLTDNRAYETRFTMPTLCEVFKLVDKKLIVNIEIKVPNCPELKARYNWQGAAKAVVDLVDSMQLQEHVFTSSFDYEALKEVETHSDKTLRTIYLTNYWNHWKVPNDCETFGSGVNI